ncbi:hypothetical protein Tco_0719041 [Tanacetum coccineum]
MKASFHFLRLQFESNSRQAVIVSESCAIGKGCKKLKSLSDCYFLSDMGLEAVAAVLNMHILKLMFAIILTHTGLKASEDLAFCEKMFATASFLRCDLAQLVLRRICRWLKMIPLPISRQPRVKILSSLLERAFCIFVVGPGLKAVDEFYQKVSNKASIKNVCRPLLCIQAERAVCTSDDEAKTMLTRQLEYYIFLTMTNIGSCWGVVMSRNARFSDQVVELDFLYPSEGIHRRWESGYRITSMAATPDQAVTSRLADLIYR